MAQRDNFIGSSTIVNRIEIKDIGFKQGRSGDRSRYLFRFNADPKPKERRVLMDVNLIIRFVNHVAYPPCIARFY
jgi:hypothetical protein